jgi:hypothetical protein
MLPLARPVGAAEYAVVVRAMVRVIKSMLDDPTRWKIDPTKLHMGDLFYVPGQYETATADDGAVFAPDNEFRVLDGEIWEPEMWCRLADILSPIPPEPPPPERNHDDEDSFNPDSTWNPEVNCAEKLAEYRSAGDDRCRKLMSLMQSLANSARFWRYDLTAAELADIVETEQTANPPHRGSSRYKRKTLFDKAASSISAAASFVTEQVYQAPVDPPDRWIDEPDDFMREVMERRNGRLNGLNGHASSYTKGFAGKDGTREACDANGGTADHTGSDFF